jgi:hypothetical protein
MSYGESFVYLLAIMASVWLLIKRPSLPICADRLLAGLILFGPAAAIVVCLIVLIVFKL